MSSGHCTRVIVCLFSCFTVSSIDFKREREISFSHWRTWRTPVRWPGDRVTITDSSLECSSFILSSWGKGLLLLRLNQKIFHLLAWWYFSVVHIFKATHQNTLVQMNNLVLDCFFNNIWNLFLISIDKNLLQADSFFFHCVNNPSQNSSHLYHGLFQFSFVIQDTKHLHQLCPQEKRRVKSSYQHFHLLFKRFCLTCSPFSTLRFRLFMA